jgi:hypothetical protein
MGERITTIDRRKGAGSYWDKNSIEYISIVEDIKEIAEKHRTRLLDRREASKSAEEAKALDRAAKRAALAEENSRWMTALKNAMRRSEDEGGVISRRCKEQSNV